ARSAAFGGTAVPREATVRSGQAAGSAVAAGAVARDAAERAQAAAATAQAAASAPPPAAPPAPVTQTYPSEPLVTITSSPPDSVVGEYRIDMAVLDTNGDGRLSRAEARPNATLSAEFAAVDNNGDGVLDREELRGWLR